MSISYLDKTGLEHIGELVSNAKTRNNKLNSVGSNLVLDNTIDDYSIDVNKFIGDTEQETTTGKNLFYFQFTDKSANGITATYSNGVLTIDGTATAQTDISYTGANFTLLKNTPYTLTSYCVGGSMSGTATYYNQNNVSWQGLTLALNNDVASVTRDSTYTNVDLVLNDLHFIRINNGASFSNYKVKFQLEQNSSATSFEPYTNGPSPNPDYSQEVQTVTGRQEISVSGKNLFDKNNLQGHFFYNTNTYTPNSTNNDWDCSKFIAVESNTSYTVSLEKTGDTSAYGQVVEWDKDKNGVYSIWNYIENRTFTTKSNTKYITVAYKNTNYTNVQVEKGSKTDYESFRGGSYEINLGKNLFDKDNVLQGSAWGSSANRCVYYVGKIYAGDKYTITNNSSSFDFDVAVSNYSSQNASTSASDDSGWVTGNNHTITASKDGYLYIQIRYSNDANLTPSDVSAIELQCEKGSQATPYSAYKTPIELCKIGTYQDYIYKSNGTWYKHKVIGKIVLDGINISANSKDGTTKNNAFYIPTTITNILNISTSTLPNILCDYFTSATVNRIYNNDIKSIGYFISSGNARILLGTGLDSQITTIQLLNNFLATYNPVLYYVLATPVEEEITDTELINQLEALQLTTKNGITYIDSLSDDLPIILDIDYEKNHFLNLNDKLDILNLINEIKLQINELST